MKLTEGGRLDRPNVCTICERTPEIGSAVVDTEKYFDGWPATLQGRRYVCKKCADQINKLIKGDVPEIDWIQIKAERDEAQRELRRLKRAIDELGFTVGSLRE